MPPGAKKPPKGEADKIAAFMHASFYSPLAQERNRPARIELSRLTVRQYKNAVTDLVRGSQPIVPQADKHGLKAEYYKGRYFDKKGLVFERIDPEIQFDFGSGAPQVAEFDPYRFAIAWQGSVLAPDTGEYQFILRSDQAARMWINDSPQPVVDGWVRANSDKEFRGSIHLIGGRAYPVRIEFSKATQGVDEPGKEKKKPPANAHVALLWKRPHMSEAAVPSQNLLPAWTKSSFVITTPFPADDRSIGYERGNSVSKEWSDATTAAALETAGFIAERLPALTGVADDAPDRKARLMAYCRDFVSRAFRRPLTKELDQTYIEKQFEAAPTLETAVKRVVILSLKSPRFLYREVDSEKDAYDTASHLSFSLWDTIPDDELVKAAAAGQLATPGQIEKQAERMANDPRAWNKLRDFLLLWLKVDEVPEIVKSQKKYPGFDEAVTVDLRTSLELFLEDVSTSKDSDYRQLILSKKQFLNERLAKVYGTRLASGHRFQPVELDKRFGVLTHPYLLSRFAYLETSSPIHRGVLIARSLLGRNLQPPPAAFTPLAPSLHPSLTTRERVALQTKPAACRSCHDLVNPLGFTLERFDAIGRIRDQENGKSVDSTGSYRSRTGELVKFSGPTDLAKYLAGSEEAHNAFVEKLFVHLLKQPPLAYGSKTLPENQRSFKKNQYSIRRAMVDIVVSTAPSQVKSQ